MKKTKVAKRSALELSPDELLAIDQLASRYLAEYGRSFAERSPMGSAHDPRKNSTRKGLKIGYAPSAQPPEKPYALKKSLELVFKKLVPLSQLPGHPGYMAYVAGAGTHLASLAQMIAMDLNPFSGHSMMAPGLVALEQEALGWFKTMLGYPQSAAGFFTSGSSLATFSALVTARVARLGDEFSRGTYYVSDQSHHSVKKAAHLAGLPPHHLRVVPTDLKTQRIDLACLEAMIAEDKRSGHKPFFVVGNAGTTNTGAIDDLEAIGAIAAREGLWFHADGAYGALFRITAEGKKKLKGLSRADSICFDPHKAFAMPYGTGALLVREGRWLKLAHAGSSATGSGVGASGSYMPPEPDTEADHADFADLTPELSRDWRGFRVWLPIKTLGLKPYRDHLEEKLRLTRWVANELRATEGLELVAEPELSILAFRVNAPSHSTAGDPLTDALLARVNERHRVFLSGCTLGGRRAIRICLLSFRAHEREARLAVSEIRRALAEVMREAEARGKGTSANTTTRRSKSIRNRKKST